MQCGVILFPCFSDILIFVCPKKCRAAPRPCLHRGPQSHFQAPWVGPTLAAQGQERGCLSRQVMHDRVGRETQDQALSMVISLGQRQVAGWGSDPGPAQLDPEATGTKDALPVPMPQTHTCKDARAVVAGCQGPQAAAPGCHGPCLAPSPPAQTPGVLPSVGSPHSSSESREANQLSPAEAARCPS